MEYVIEEANLQKDKERILAVWERNALPISEHRYAWMYVGNPEGPTACWFAKRSMQGIVGVSGLANRRMRIGDRLVRVAQAIDFAIDRSHRSLGPALILQRVITTCLQQKEVVFTYAFPNHNAEVVLLKAGYKTLGYFQRWTKPMRPEYMLKRYIKSRSLMSVATAIVDLVMKMMSDWQRYKRPAGIKTAIQDTFDKRFDTLWESASRQFGAIGDRTSNYLTWRFQQCPQEKYLIFCVTDSAESLLGYVVYSRNNGFVSIADLLFTDVSSLDILLSEFLLQMISDRIASITINYLGTPVLAKKLQAFGFYKRAVTEKVLVYLTNEAHRLSGNLLDTDQWYLTECDKDI